MKPVEYFVGSDLPDLSITWIDSRGQIIDFTGHTFEFKIAPYNTIATSFTKVSGIAGAATAPNIVVSWATVGELNTLAAGDYTIEITATRISDGKQRKMQSRITVKAALT